jgi:pimeloyl-ACP methyl ester carboxylesterase
MALRSFADMLILEIPTLLWLILLPLVFAVAFLFSLWYLPRVGSRSLTQMRRFDPVARDPSKAAQFDPAHHQLTVERAEVPTRAGHTLHTWVLTQPDAGPHIGTLILLHGMHLSKVAFLGHGRQFCQRGWRVVMPDLRAHGLSGGAHCTFGLEERYDLQDLIAWLERDFGITEVALMGISLGGIVTLHTLPIAPQVKAAVVQSPYTSLWDEINFTLRQRLGLLSSAYMPRVRAEMLRQIKLDPKTVDLRKQIALRSQPVLIIAGGADAEVPPAHARELYRLAPKPCELWEVPSAGHNNIHKIAPDYFDRITQFLRQSMA